MTSLPMGSLGLALDPADYTPVADSRKPVRALPPDICTGEVREFFVLLLILRKGDLVSGQDPQLVDEEYGNNCDPGGEDSFGGTHAETPLYPGAVHSTQPLIRRSAGFLSRRVRSS